jgi:hypothetical protein
MQLAVQDIGQLTDIGFIAVNVGFSADVRHQRRPDRELVTIGSCLSPARYN